MCGKPAVPNISPNPESERGDRIFHQPARLHDVDTFRCTAIASLNRLLKLKPTFHHHKGHKAGTEQQRHGFDNLHQVVIHAAEQDVHHHQHADQHHRRIVKAKQQLDLPASPSGR